MAVRLLSHTRAVLLALFVTLLWSTSWVLIKIGLQDIPALTFAGLRYTLAFVMLLAAVNAALAWVFLGEHISGQGITGLALAALGMLIVQVYTPRRVAETEEGVA